MNIFFSKYTYSTCTLLFSMSHHHHHQYHQEHWNACGSIASLLSMYTQTKMCMCVCRAYDFHVYSYFTWWFDRLVCAKRRLPENVNVKTKSFCFAECNSIYHFESWCLPKVQNEQVSNLRMECVLCAFYFALVPPSHRQIHHCHLFWPKLRTLFYPNIQKKYINCWSGKAKPNPKSSFKLLFRFYGVD